MFASRGEVDRFAGRQAQSVDLLHTHQAVYHDAAVHLHSVGDIAACGNNLHSLSAGVGYVHIGSGVDLGRW